MPTLPLPNLSTHKGVRRPFGNINVNRTDPSNSKNKSSKKDGKTVSKAVIKSSATSAFAVVSKQEKKEVVDQALPVTAVDQKSDQEGAQETLEAAQAISVFRRVPSEESVMEQMPSLQLANPINDENNELELDNQYEEAAEQIYLPFTRADGCSIVEPVSAQSVRSIFRKSATSEEEERDDLLNLRRGNPIMEDDGIVDEGQAQQTGNVQTLFLGQGHMLESMSIMDLMTI